MAVVPQVTCDCGGRHSGEAQHYYIELPSGVRWNVDLCDSHAARLTDFVDKGIGRQAEPPSPPGRRRTFRKTDPADLITRGNRAWKAESRPPGS